MQEINEHGKTSGESERERERERDEEEARAAFGRPQ